MLYINKNKTGARIRRLRRDKLSMSAEQLGELLYVSANAIYAWEVGTAMPNLDTMVNLVRLLDMDISDLLIVEENNG